MAKSKILGIYLGMEGIGVAEVEKKKIKASAYLPFSVLEEEVASYDELTRKIKIEALLQRVIRKIKSEAVDTVIGLSDKDLTFRMIDMPVLKKKELDMALPLEIEKYMPFKLDDVAWGYKTKHAHVDKKTNVAFLAARKELVSEALDIAGNAGLNPLRFDGASLCCVDLLFDLKKISTKHRDFAVLFCSGNEAEICIFNGRFPKFSRYTKVPVDFKGKLNLPKFIDDVRLTLEYYKREAGRVQLEKIYIVTTEPMSGDFASISDEILLPAEVVLLESVISGHQITSMYELKAFALALRAFGRSVNGYNLLKDAIPDMEQLMESGVSSYFKARSPDVPLDPGPSIMIAVLGVFAFIGLYFYLQYKTFPVEKELAALRKEVSAQEISKSKQAKVKNEIARIKKINAQLKDVKPIEKELGIILDIIGDDVGEGIWFDSIRTAGLEDGKPLFTVAGNVYIDSPELERESFNSWIIKLKENRTLIERQYAVTIDFIEFSQSEGYDVTRFQIRVYKDNG